MSVDIGEVRRTDVRVLEWHARNPLRRWRIRGRRGAPEVELQLRLPRGQILAWETGAASPDARALRALTRMTGIADLTAEWARWISVKPASRDGAQAFEGLPDGAGESAPTPAVAPAAREALDRILAEIVGWGGPDSPMRARDSWEAMPIIVEGEIGRARSLGAGLALVLWEVVARPATVTEAAWIACLHRLAGQIGRRLPSGGSFFHDETGRFIVLLFRVSEAAAREYAAVMEPVLAHDPLVTDVFGEPRLALRTMIASYPMHGETAEALLGRLDPGIGAAVGKIDAYGASSA